MLNRKRTYATKTINGKYLLCLRIALKVRLAKMLHYGAKVAL